MARKRRYCSHETVPVCLKVMVDKNHVSFLGSMLISFLKSQFIVFCICFMYMSMVTHYCVLQVTFDFEPFKPINASLYLCDNKFHTEALNELLESDDKFGFIVMDGNGTLFGTLSGNTREVLHKFTVDLPKKHGRGGQSALRFARLRMEKRHNYVRKTAELATQFYINPATSQPNVSGISVFLLFDFGLILCC